MTGSLIPAYRQLHEAGHFPGLSIRPFVPEIAQLVVETRAKSLLDCGCGKGHQYIIERFHEAWGPRPTLYDPGVSEHDTKPAGRFDGVITTDMLEHIPEDELDAVVADLVRYARLWCFASVCCRPAKRRFPDGSNVHVTIRPFAWWQDRLGRAFEGRARLVLRESA